MKALVRLPRVSGLRNSKGPKGNMALGFVRPGLSSGRVFRVDWPVDRAFLWAYQQTDRHRLLGSLNADFVIANIPEGHKVYFAVGEDEGGDHWKLKQLLKDDGDVFHEKVDLPAPPRNSAGREPTPIAILVGSTIRPEIIRVIFDWYAIYWESNFHYPFLVSEREPPPWKDWMEALLKQHTITADMIENSYCIMTTVWEHGMELVSDKISRATLEETTRKVAELYRLKLTVYDD